MPHTCHTPGCLAGVHGHSRALTRQWPAPSSAQVTGRARDRSSKLVMPVRSRSPALKLLAAPVSVGATPDVNDEDFMLLLVDLVQHAPIPHDACAPGTIQRRTQRLPQPFRIADQWSRYEVDGGSRHVWRKLARDSPPRWRRKSYRIDVKRLSHVARRGGHAQRPLPGRRRPGPRLHVPRSAREPPRSRRGPRLYLRVLRGRRQAQGQRHAHDRLGPDEPRVHAPPIAALRPRGAGCRPTPPRSSRTRVRSCLQSKAPSRRPPSTRGVPVTCPMGR